MNTKSLEVTQGNGVAPLPTSNNPQSAQLERQPYQAGGGGNAIFKCGPLFISSKGIGWTSWKKRWFILTQTSLVFFRSDPSAAPMKGTEVNLTLGGIDLNNSGSVVVKADKKLLTVQFPDVPDGRAFTLKAETMEDLYEWKTALEQALAKAPSPANVMEQNVKDREPARSTVIGRPILLALEDVDGTPSFLEKALRFIEEHGASVEGILRQSADVEDVKRRVQEYEQGKVEFSTDEDAHVIGDCIKHVLREMPSSPVPASCCKALLEACRTDRGGRVCNMRAAINETFPEPNRRLLQRILLMMQTVASRKAVNRMSSSAVAACMAPLLLRPLLAGECEIENDFDVGGDGSAQLLQAAAAANHAQAICITLLEEYDSIFGEGSMSPDIYTDTEESGSETEAATDDDLSYEDDDDYDDEEEEEDESIQGSDVDDEDLVSESYTETGDSEDHDGSDDKDHDRSSSSSKSSGVIEESKVNQMPASKSLKGSLSQREKNKVNENLTSPTKNACVEQSNNLNSPRPRPSSTMKKSISNGPAPRNRTMLGRTSARKNLSMESIDFPVEDDDEMERLEAVRSELQEQIAEEVKGTDKLQSHIEQHKEAMQERRLVLEQEVARLHEKLRKEKNHRATLESKAELEELSVLEADLTYLERKVKELGLRLNPQPPRNHGSTVDSCNQPQQKSNHETKLTTSQSVRKNKAETVVAATSQSDRKNKAETVVAASSQSDRKNKAETVVAATSQSDRKNKAETVVAATSQSDKTMIKDPHLGGAENVNERKPESTQYKHPPAGSKKPSTKGEVRRGQAGNEVQSVDKGRESSYSQNLERGKGSEHQQTLPSSNRVQGSETHSVSNPEKVRGLSSVSLQIPDKDSGRGKSHKNAEKFRKSESQSSHHSDGWTQNPKHLERGMSEAHHFNNADKGR